MIRIVMKPDAIFPHHGTFYNEFCRSGKISQLNDPGSNNAFFIIIVDLLCENKEFFVCPLKPQIGPYYAHIVPHEPFYIFNIMLHKYPFIKVKGRSEEHTSELQS